MIEATPSLNNPLLVILLPTAAVAMLVTHSVGTFKFTTFMAQMLWCTYLCRKLALALTMQRAHSLETCMHPVCVSNFDYLMTCA